MHGRPRRSVSDEVSKEKDRVKAAELRSLQEQFLKNHKEKIYTKEALKINATLLELNPEVYTAWNYRKLAVNSFLESEHDSSAIQQMLEEELRVAERALKRNCKSYGAWHHRKWVISMGYCSLDRELQLLDQLLKLDARNFHGWNYRRFIANLKKTAQEEELEFTTKKINENFSNYSAWHNRSAVLSELLKSTPTELERQQTLSAEYELVKQALFTDSEDQSGWFFYLWLLGQTIGENCPRLQISWPYKSSHLIVDFEEHSGMLRCYFLTPFGNDNNTFSEGIPIVLHFSEPITGVSPTSIKENDMFENNLLYWLPASSHGSSRTWFSKLKLSTTNLPVNNLKAEVIATGPIKTSTPSGCRYLDSSILNFTVELRKILTSNQEESDMVPVSWEDEQFSCNKDEYVDSPVVKQLSCLTNGSSIEDQSKFEWQKETLAKEIADLNELIELVPKCKWAKLTLARLLIAEEIIYSLSGKENRGKHTDEILEIFKSLSIIDSSHAEYYKEWSDLVFVDKVIDSKETLKHYCWKSNHETLTEREQNNWLRLHGLSLSRIGSLGDLLWLQRLDISHNNLKSIEGMETLHLLTALNLSHNKLSHFTALGPLQGIKTLRALNISYNRIGASAIDTKRYRLPLVLIKPIDDNEELHLDSSSFWVVAIFQGFHLQQLDIAGNPASETCKPLLLKALPSLQWLDGEYIDESTNSTHMISFQ